MVKDNFYPDYNRKNQPYVKTPFYEKKYTLIVKKDKKNEGIFYKQKGDKLLYKGDTHSAIQYRDKKSKNTNLYVAVDEDYYYKNEKK